MSTDYSICEFSREQLLSDLKLTKTALDDAYSNFEQVVDPDLVDSYIYEVNAVQKRYHFLLKQVQLLDLQNAIESAQSVKKIKITVWNTRLLRRESALRFNCLD